MDVTNPSESGEAHRKRIEAHLLMESALKLLDESGDTLVSAYLDHAIATLGLRDVA